MNDGLEDIKDVDGTITGLTTLRAKCRALNMLLPQSSALAQGGFVSTVCSQTQTMNCRVDEIYVHIHESLCSDQGSES